LPPHHRNAPPLRIIQQTESSFAQNHESFFNNIDPKQTFDLELVATQK